MIESFCSGDKPSAVAAAAASPLNISAQLSAQLKTPEELKRLWRASPLGGRIKLALAGSLLLLAAALLALLSACVFVCLFAVSRAGPAAARLVRFAAPRPPPLCWEPLLIYLNLLSYEHSVCSFAAFELGLRVSIRLRS